MNAVPVKCSACEALFGYENNGVLNIKHRDLFRQIIGGTVKGPCRRCGAEVIWSARNEISDDDSRT
jgi:hypothetical protein